MVINFTAWCITEDATLSSWGMNLLCLYVYAMDLLHDFHTPLLCSPMQYRPEVI